MDQEQSELYKKGMAVRRKVLGDAYVDSVTANLTDFDRPWQKLVTEHAWGDIWASEGELDLKQRSLNNLCLLAALNRSQELAAHVRGALRNGCSVDEIRETLMQVAVYAGIPAGVEAFRVAGRVLAEEGIKP